MDSLTLDHTATKEDMEKLLKDHYRETDSDITDEDIDAAWTAHQSHLAWRQSLPITDRVELLGTPITSAPEHNAKPDEEEVF